MKIENTQIFGFEGAFRGMRNPMNSWDKNDSSFGAYGDHTTYYKNGHKIDAADMPIIGPNDFKLALKLIKGGSEHRKFLRQIMIWVDFTIPRYVWQELDTYKVATVRNSCSTMHKLGHTDLTTDDFEDGVVLKETLQELNKMGQRYRNKEDYIYNPSSSSAISYSKNELLRLMKQILPEGFLQKATYTFNYETALTILRQRSNHRLPEWRKGCDGSICEWLLSLPYMKEFAEAASNKK